VTVSAQTPYNLYAGNGVTTVFPYTFKVLSSGDLDVYVSGVLKALGVDYTVSGVGADVGGSVTFLTGAPGGTTTVSIIRTMEVSRSTDYQQQGDFNADTVNPDFDRAILLIQDLHTQIGRTIRTPVDEVGTIPTLPSIANRAGKYLSFDALGQPIGSVGTGNDSALRTDLASTTSGSDGSRLSGYRRPDTGTVAQSVHNVLKRQVWLEDFGGAPGMGNDNTLAMNAATTAVAALGGGVIRLGSPGEWRMNWVCLDDNITLRGFGGRSEFDLNCVRPFNIASAAITIGNGVANVRYCALERVHLSGTNDPGAANFDNETVNAPHCLKLAGCLDFLARDCVFYNGLHTIQIQPSATVPVSSVGFDNCHFRNDLDGAGTRLIWAKRLLDPGYITDVTFLRCHFNSHTEYFAELDGTVMGFSLIFIEGYADVRAHKGVLIKGNAQLRTFALDIDPATAPTVIIEYDGAQADPTRILFGYLTQGGQLIQFNGTVLDSGTLQGAGASTATIRAAAAFADNALTNQTIRILTGTGAGQQRRIVSNVGATDVVTVVTPWDVTPNAASTYDIVQTVLIPAEGDWNLYQPRIHRAFLGPVTYVTPSDNPYATTISWDLSGTTLTLTGANLYTQNIRIVSADAILEFLETDQTTDGQLWYQRVNSSSWRITTRLGNGGAGKDGIVVARTAGSTTIASIDIGNGTDLPAIRLLGTVGFQGSAAIAKPTVTGAKGGNAALASLMTALANYGLVTDTTT
jgi:hypothetical protein